MPPAEYAMQCPACNTLYPLEAKFCRVDGTPLVAAATPTSPAPPVQAPRPAPGGAGQNRTAIVALATVVALLALVGIGYSLFHSRPPRASSEQRGSDASAGRSGGPDGSPDRPGSPSPREEASSDATKGRDNTQGGDVVTDDRRTAGEVAQTESKAEKTRSQTPVLRCTESACFELFAARLSPATARPGQTVRCTARYTFRHNEGGHGPLQVEQSVQAGIRSSRGESRRVDSGPGPNSFDLAFRVPDRAAAGTYPVTLSVRRRRVTESIKLQLVVVR